MSVREGKSEFIDLSLFGVAALFSAGFEFAETVEALRTGNHWLGALLIAVMFALMVRWDARIRPMPGSYRRRFFFWRREGQ